MSAGFRKSLFGFNCEDVMEYIEKSQKSFVEREKDLSEQVEKLSADLELSNDNYRKLNEEKETISKKLEEFNEKYEEIGRLSENIGKLYLVAQANARAIMANSEKNAGLAAAQVHGGMSMAIGYGLSEQLLYDKKTGRPLNNNLLDYKLSTTMDHPHLEAQFVENYEPTSAYGTKALGEPPACSAAPAIRNAILHATGVAIDQAPITPHILFAKFTEAGLIQD